MPNTTPTGIFLPSQWTRPSAAAPPQPSLLCQDPQGTSRPPQWYPLTVDSEGHAGIAHAHHILSDARQGEAVVLTRHIYQRQVDGVNVGPVQICLKSQEKRQPSDV